MKKVLKAKEKYLSKIAKMNTAYVKFTDVVPSDVMAFRSVKHADKAVKAAAKLFHACDEVKDAADDLCVVTQDAAAKAYDSEGGENTKKDKKQK